MLSQLFNLIRVRQWQKNLLIFATPVGANQFFKVGNFPIGFFGFISMSFAASGIYVINDYIDRKHDRLHPKKRLRPLASGSVPISYALLSTATLIGLALLISFKLSTFACFVLFVYLIMNVFYALKLKNEPIIEIGIVATSYVLRIIFGGYIFNIKPSSWLLITTFTLAFGIVASKRKCELAETNIYTRKVLAHYSLENLQNLVIFSMATSFTSYSFWVFEKASDLLLLAFFCEVISILIFSKLISDSSSNLLQYPEKLFLNKSYSFLVIIFVICNILLIGFK